MIDDVRLAPDELEAAGIRTVIVAVPVRRFVVTR